MRASSVSGNPRPLAVVELGGAFVLALGSVFVVMDLLLNNPLSSFVAFLAVLAAFALAYQSRRYHDPRFLGLWVGAAAVLAIVSTVTGFLNGLTDEPYATPAFVQLFPNLYGGTLNLTYYQYGGGPHSLSASYIYLPLLPFVQIPGVDYRWVTLAAWAAMVYLVRKSPAAVLLLGAPWVALLAANGFNDFVALAFLTLLFSLREGAWARVAEVVSLGLKQFANVIIVVYYLVKRRWAEALLAVGITVAFLLPFALIDASGVYCHALTLAPGPACGGGGGGALLSAAYTHLNYYLWLLWPIAIFGPVYVTQLRGPEYATERTELAADLSRRSPESVAPTDLDWSLLLLPFYRLRGWLRRDRPGPDPKS